MQYNETINNFFIEKNINYSLIEKNKDAICFNKKEINSIISRYGMYKNKNVERVCVKNIIGKYRGKTQNILTELNDLFDENAESYKKRSTSMLKYNSDEIVSKLENSFEIEPIELKEIKNGKYIIGNNGMHRINLLRTHYFNELNKLNNKEIIQLQNKYTVSANIEHLDIIKTYSRYLISLFDKSITIEDEINENFLKTENVILYDDNNLYGKFDNKKLILFVENKIDEIVQNGHAAELIKLYQTDEYFMEYIELFSKKIINKNIGFNKI